LSCGEDALGLNATVPLYLVTRSLHPTGRGKTRWAMYWKPALNAFAITFEGRILPSNTN
jgi:putative transposase